jgi:DNA repair photolyase
MKFKGWDKVIIKTKSNSLEEGIAPVIISASRSTDIPAFYSDWFFDRLKDGYLIWINPFNNQSRYVSFEKTRLIVFWTKNAKPIIPYLTVLDNLGINYYFQFTLNNYDDELIEPNVPSIKERIDTFKMLSTQIGADKVIWRFDPLLIIKDKINIDTLLRKINFVGDEIHEYTKKLVFSFADIENYRNVKANMIKLKIDYIDFDENLMTEIAYRISKLNEKWHLDLATCGEKVDLSPYNISHNKCIDDGLIRKIFSNDKELMKFLETYNPLKDKGQRSSCGCILSKDIGKYNTCKHSCIYCYANKSKIKA